MNNRIFIKIGWLFILGLLAYLFFVVFFLSPKVNNFLTETEINNLKTSNFINSIALNSFIFSNKIYNMKFINANNQEIKLNSININ